MAGWHPGDPSPSGIMLSLSYLAVAGACGIVARRQGGRWPGRAIWSGLALAFVAVAVERQAGLLDLVTAIMRARAEAAGDYAARRPGQAAALLVIALVAGAVGTVLVTLASRAGRCSATIAGVLTLTIAYLAGKAVSLHRVDEIVFRRVDGIAAGNWIECGLVTAAGITILLALAVDQRAGDAGRSRR